MSFKMLIMLGMIYIIFAKTAMCRNFNIRRTSDVFISHQTDVLNYFNKKLHKFSIVEYVNS